MRLTPYLQFRDGRCREALAFYGEVLGGTLTNAMSFGDMPGPDGVPVSDDWKDKVMHAEFAADGFSLFACDSPPQYQQAPGGILLTLNVDTPAEAERIFGRLSEGGSVAMPMEETFWAQRFGMLNDRFGMPWMVSCDKPAA